MGRISLTSYRSPLASNPSTQCSVQYSAFRESSIQYNTIQYNTIQYITLHYITPPSLTLKPSWYMSSERRELPHPTIKMRSLGCTCLWISSRNAAYLSRGMLPLPRALIHTCHTHGTTRTRPRSGIACPSMTAGRSRCYPSPSCKRGESEFVSTKNATLF